MPRKPAFCRPVHGDAEHRLPGPARLADSHAGVLDAVAPFVVVEIVGFAVGDDQQQPAFAALLCQIGRGMTDRRAEAGVKAGTQRGDALFDL